MDPAAKTNVRTWLTIGGVSVAVIVACVLLVRDGDVSSAEQSMFRAINELTDALEPPMVVVQFAGIAVAPFIVAAIAAVFRKWRLVIAALLVLPLKLFIERVVLKEIVFRGRPGRTEPDAILRADVPSHGPSFPSGHVILAFAMAGIVAPYLSRGWRIVVWVGALAVAFSRIYLGAHNPLDVVAGAASGLLIASVLNLLLLPHRAPTTTPARATT